MGFGVFVEECWTLFRVVEGAFRLPVFSVSGQFLANN